MALKKYMLFFTPMCPNCPKIKAFMQDKGLEHEWVDAATKEGLEKARQFEVGNVPAAIFFDENGKEVARASSVDEIKRLLENKSLSDA